MFRINSLKRKGPKKTNSSSYTFSDKKDLKVLAAKIFQPINWVGISKIIFHQVKEQEQGRKRKSSYKFELMMTHDQRAFIAAAG